MPRTSLVSGALTLAAVAALAAACGESPSAPGAPAPVPTATRYECRGDVAARTVTCSVPTPSGARGDVLLGNQGVHTRLTSSNVAVVADSFMFDETVTNLLNVPIGTTDGTTPDPDGVRVFFTGPIATTAGTGTVDVANADGVGTFTASNQPFFAYHEIIAPNATSAAKRWKLRFDPGVQHFTFHLLVSAPYPPGTGSVHMTVLQPFLGNPVGDSVSVLVQVDSASADIASVVASAAGRAVALFPSGGRMAGVLDLTGIPPQTLQLRVVGTTVNGDSGVVLQSFNKDARPRLVVSSPHAGVVARPDIRIDVDCIDDDPAGCTSVKVQGEDSFGRNDLATGTTSIHTTLSLAAYDGRGLQLNFFATDSRGQTPARETTVNPIYVMTSAALVLLDSAGARALDVDSTRLLYVNVGETEVRIHDRVASTTTLLRTQAPSPSCTCPNNGHLHPQGAIWIDTGGLFDWNSGTLTGLGNYNRLSVAGDWAAFTNGDVLIRRDLVSGTNNTVASGFTYNPWVAPNGDVVWDRATQAILRYHNGTVETLTGTGYYEAPVTDGTNVLYLKDSSPLAHEYLVLAQGGDRSNISSVAGMSEGYTNMYQANGGWIAYLSYDGTGVVQIRARSPLGNDVQVTHSISNCRIRALANDGTLAYSCGQPGVPSQPLILKVLRAPYTGTPTSVATDPGEGARFRGTELLYILGNSAFHVNY